MSTLINIEEALARFREEKFLEIEDSRMRNERQLKAIQARLDGLQTKFEEQVAKGEQRLQAEAKWLRAVIEGEEQPALIVKWLFMDSWSHEDGLLLLNGFLPLPEHDALHRREMAAKLCAKLMCGESALLHLKDVWGLCYWHDYSNLVPDWRRILVGAIYRFESDSRLIREIWSSGTHPERPTPVYFVDWAQRKGFKIPWLKWAQEQEHVPFPTAREQLVTDVERASLQKQVAALALVLAEKSGRYKNGAAPNGNQIAEAVKDILDALPDAKTRGVSSSAIRASIKAGVDLLNG